MTTQHTTFCRICEALCGLEVTVADGRVTRIRPDARHPVTAGFGCAKGMNQHLLYDSPDRLKTPLRREGARFVPISWAEALVGIGARVRRLRARRHADAIAMYIGTAAGFSVLHPMFAQGFMLGVGSRNTFSTATQDCSNKFAVAERMYGFPFTQPFPDVARARCLIIVGANPVVSKWSFLQVPNPARQLKAIVARGGRVFVVDPRRTETAKAAGEHVFIRPGTDVYFYLSFLHEVCARGLVDAARVRPHTRGLDAVRSLARAWPPERTAPVTQIPAARLRALVDAYLEADGAALYCSTGVNMGPHGALAFWIQEVINAVSGNLDRAGGTLVGRGIIDFPAFAKRRGLLVRDDRSRVGGFRSVNDAFPGAILADEILTPGERQIRALFVTGGNPLLAMANAGRLRTALDELELLVVVDLFLNETASRAHYVLPATSPLQRPDLPFLFPLLLGLQSTPYLQATRAVVPPEGEQRDEASIYVALCRAAGVNLFGSRVAQRLLELSMRPRRPGGQPAVPQARLLDLLLRACRQGGFRELLAHAHGRLRAPHRAGDFLGSRVLTEDGRVDLAPRALVEQAGGLAAAFARELELVTRGPAPLRLITRRHVLSHNTWTHNHARYAGPRRPTNFLYMHPDDAAARGLEHGALADVSTKTARVRVPVARCPDLMPGTVALPHGWGHQHARGLAVASATRGVNVNLLAADGPGSVDEVSNMVQLTGLTVEVRPAAGAQAHDWSGLPASVDV